jgi:hypothetical protein
MNVGQKRSVGMCSCMCVHACVHPRACSSEQLYHMRGNTPHDGWVLKGDEGLFRRRGRVWLGM